MTQQALGQRTGEAAPSVGKPTPREARSENDQPLDERRIRDTALASLVRAERTFMLDVAKRRVDGWVDGFADSGVTFPANRPVNLGRDAIRRQMTPVFADTSVHVAWHPVYAAIASSGDLGYTYGFYRWTSRDAKGAPDKPDLGKYLTIWRRDPSGRWRVVADVGNAGPVPPTFFIDP